MSLQLSDLDELLQSVKNTHAKNYLSEAIVAYRSGAYRVAVISTWISICVDVIEKIKELSIGGDAAANAIKEKLNAIHSHDFAGMQAFEKDILTFACDKLELISHIEKSHLERIKDDRNICAHPTFSMDGSQFVPSPELTRAYIVQAATYLLVRPPIRGKAVVESIFNLINEESFPEDDEKAFIILSSDKYLGRVRDASARSLIIILLKRLFKDEDGLNSQALNRIAVALGAISRLFPGIYSTVLTEKLSQMLADANEKLLKRAIPFLCRRLEAWGKVEVAVALRLDGCISNMDASEMIAYRVANLACHIPGINYQFQTAISKFESDDIYNLAKSTPSKSLKEKSIEIFVSSRSYAYAYLNGINILIPHAQYINDSDLDKLFKGIYDNSNWRNNQILNAGGIGEVFSLLYQKTKDNVENHSRLWLGFVEYVSKEQHKYDELNEQLIKDGLLNAEEGEGSGSVSQSPDVVEII